MCGIFVGCSKMCEEWTLHNFTRLWLWWWWLLLLLLLLLFGLRRRPPLRCRCVRCCGCCGGNPLSACQSLPGVQADDSESDGDLAFATMSHHTSRKVNMGPEHGGLDDGVPFKMWFWGSMLIFQGVFAFRGMNASGTDILCVRATLKLPFVNPGPCIFFGRMYVCTCDVTTVYYII